MTDSGAEHDELAYVAAVERESRRFLAVLRAAPATARVPSCPDWTALDLLWHLAEVQWFWSEIVLTQAREPGAAEAAKPPRPTDRAELEAFAERARDRLLEALTAGRTTPVWTWWSPDQTVGFVRRRQAHEALIHRVDAELVVGDRSPLEPALAADGVDEALRIMHGGIPPWGTFTAGPLRVRVEATDTGDSWLAAVGTFTGTAPDGSWEGVDEPMLQVMRQDDEQPAPWTAPDGVALRRASVAAAAADLDCLLWNRPPLGPVQRWGDPDALAGFDQVIGDGVQ